MYYQIYIKVVQQKYGTTATLTIEANIQKMFKTFVSYELKIRITYTYIHINSIHNVLTVIINDSAGGDVTLSILHLG